MSRKAIADWEREFRQQRGLADSDPVPVTLESPTYSQQGRRKAVAKASAKRDADRSSQPNLGQRLLAAGAEGVVDTMGLPVDLINGAADLVELPEDYRLLGGADDLRKWAHGAGIGQIDETYAPQSSLEGFAQGLTRFAGGAAVPLGGGGVGVLAGKAWKLLRKEDAVAKFMSKNFDRKQAEYLAQDYTGEGHHFIQRKVGKRYHIPEWFMESRLNVLKPKGMSRGDFYERHFRVDPHYYHSNLPRKQGGGGWTGRRLGFEKYGLGGRLWYGSPAPLKAVGGGATGGAVATVRGSRGDD